MNMKSVILFLEGKIIYQVLINLLKKQNGHKGKRIADYIHLISGYWNMYYLLQK